MADLLVFILLALASYRITRIVTQDKITERIFDRLRWWFERRWYDRHDEAGSDTEFNSKLAYLLSCAWCLGFWVSGVGTLLVSVVYGLDYPVLTWLAVSTLVGLIGRVDSD